jgi:hypothetical protein
MKKKFRFNKQKAKKKLEKNLWNITRMNLLKRDKGCIICQRTDIIHVHHLIPREFKDFKYEIDNLVCLCPNHHKYSRDISAHKNPFEFYIWFINNRTKQFMDLITLKRALEYIKTHQNIQS